MTIDWTELEPMPPLLGPPFPKVIDPYIPWHGYWPWIHISTTGTGVLQVNTDPEGAEISINTGDTGQVTPYSFTDIPSGGYTIFLQKAGYQNVIKGVTVQDNQTVTLDVILTPVASGQVQLDLTPSDLTLMIDSQAVDVSSGYVTLSIGYHIYQATADGYGPAGGTFYVSGTNDILTIALPPLSGGTSGTVEFNLNPNYDLAIGVNNAAGFLGNYSAGQVYTLPVGVYQWNIGGVGSGNFTIYGGQQTNVNINVNINLPPGAGAVNVNTSGSPPNPAFGDGTWTYVAVVTTSANNTPVNHRASSDPYLYNGQELYFVPLGLSSGFAFQTPTVITLMAGSYMLLLARAGYVDVVIPDVQIGAGNIVSEAITLQLGASDYWGG